MYRQILCQIGSGSLAPHSDPFPPGTIHFSGTAPRKSCLVVPNSHILPFIFDLFVTQWLVFLPGTELATGKDVDRTAFK